jgi:YD repeat-containing protein
MVSPSDRQPGSPREKTMTRTRARTARAAALLAATFLAGAAAAQGSGQPPISTLVTPPAENWAVTPGGVDMRTGQYAYSHTDLSIGGDGGLELVRQPVTGAYFHTEPFGNLSHNWNILLIEKRVDLAKNNFEHQSGQDYRLSVHLGSRAETFDSPSYAGGFSYVSRNGEAVLSFSGNRSGGHTVYTFQASDGTIYIFRPIGSGDCSAWARCARVAQIIRPDNTQLSFEYDNPTGQPDGTRLRSVVSTRGYALLFEYGNNIGTHAHPAKACVLNLAFTPKPANNVCPAGVPTSSYTYMWADGRAWITSMTDPSNATWSFTYNNGMMSFFRPGESTPWLSNGNRGIVNEDMGVIFVTDSQHFATGESYSYDYATIPYVLRTSSAVVGGTITDALGRQTTVAYAFPRRPKLEYQDPFNQPPEMFGDQDERLQITPGPVLIVDPLGRQTSYEYCEPWVQANLPAYHVDRCLVGKLRHFTDPTGMRTEVELSSNNLPVRVRRIPPPGSPDPVIEHTATYACGSPKSCLKPASITDARGNTTHYRYDPAHGGIIAEAGPPAQDGLRPRTRYEYVQRHAWISNGGGGFVPAGPPIWLLSATIQCRPGAVGANLAEPCSAGEMSRTTFDYGPDSGPNNLWLRGQTVTADGVTLRTCYGYDQQGRRISETRPLANLASCQ